MRRLLPYEHALIEALGISEEEYFAFRKAQQEYKDPKAGTLLDIRNGEPFTTIALVLTILGTVFQVASVLLATPPDQSAANRNLPRDKRYAPRYGFDSLQDLAQYGDPINLVYTDNSINPNGGVRVNTSLLWSALHSYGNNQFIQMLTLLGASTITEIRPDYTAFGQTLIHQFSGSSAWLYFRNNALGASQKSVVFTDLISGGSTASTSDPIILSGVDRSRTVYDVCLDLNVRTKGFSQAFSPSSAGEFGVYTPIPIKMQQIERDDKGRIVDSSNGITVSGRGNYWPEFYSLNRSQFPEGYEIRLIFEQDRNNSNIAAKQAEESRIALSETIEIGGIYKLGSAKFQAVSLSGDEDLDNGSLTVTLRCIVPGFGPAEDYGVTSVDDEEKQNSQNIKTWTAQKEALAVQLSSARNISNYADSSLNTKQIRAIDSLFLYNDYINVLTEAATAYERQLPELDELVLEERDLYGNMGGFDAYTYGLADQVRAKEQEIEDLRDEIRDENDRDRRQRLKQRVMDAKNILRKWRSRLAMRVREKGIRTQALFNTYQEFNNIRQAIKSALGDVYFVADVELPSVRPNQKLSAHDERRRLKQLQYVCNKLQAKVAAIPQLNIQNYTSTVNAIQTQINNLDDLIAQAQYELDNKDALNDDLNTKCLVRIAEARYATLSAINIVHFSIKAKVFMRVQGRAPEYAEEKAARFKYSDNGYKMRTCMFVVKYRQVGDNVNPKYKNFQFSKSIFCVRRTGDFSSFISLAFRSPDEVGGARWEFIFEPVSDPRAQSLAMGGSPTFIYLAGRKAGVKISSDGLFYYRGYEKSSKPNLEGLPPKNKSPWGIDEWQLFSIRSDSVLQMSLDSGPELSLVAVSEQQFTNDFAQYPDIYSNMSLIGFNAYSSRGLTNVRNLSVFVNKGKKLKVIPEYATSYADIVNASSGASCYAPDIFLDTILDAVNGIGKYADPQAIDIGQLAKAKRFCKAQGYYMDGVIADRKSWRQFWSEVAPFSLLELARIGGKETLIPAVPCNEDGTITRNIIPTALFNQGNILEDSYKEEFLDYGESTQDVIATIVYREQTKESAFPRNTSLTVSLVDTVEATASRRTFDLSNFVTNRTQALNYGMLLCQQRRLVQRAIEFKTFPAQAVVRPGDYIYVQIDENEWDNIYSGTVLNDGSISIPYASSVVNGNYETLIYEPGKVPVKQTISYVNGQSSAFASYAGTGALFVLGTLVSSKRVFRVNSVAMNEDAEITISAVEHPCEISNNQVKSLIVRFESALYKIS